MKYDYADAHECIVELTERFPKNVDYLDAAAATSFACATRPTANILRDDQRQQLARQGIVFAKRIHADAVELKPQLARHLGSGARALGILAMRDGDYSEAVLHFQAAVGAANELVAKVNERPPTLSYDADVNRIYLTEALINKGCTEEAQVVVATALEHLTKSVADSPDQPLFQHSLNRLNTLRDEIETRFKPNDN